MILRACSAWLKTHFLPYSTAKGSLTEANSLRKISMALGNLGITLYGLFLTALGVIMPREKPNQKIEDGKLLLRVGAEQEERVLPTTKSGL